MSDQDMQPNLPTRGIRVRRAYLALVLGGPWVLMVVGVALIVGCFVSTQPTALRVAGLTGGVIMLLVGAFMVRFAGPLEVSVPQGGVKATVDAIPRETLLLAEDAAAQALPGDDADRRTMAAKAVLDVLRRDQAAEVLAEVRAFLTDASPDRLGINASQERSPEVLRELQERRERIRIPLLTLAGSHPTPHVRRLAQQLEVEMANMLHMAGFFVSDLLSSRAPGAAREQANKHHTAALGLLDQLLDAIHEPETGRAVSGGDLAPDGAARPPGRPVT